MKLKDSSINRERIKKLQQQLKSMKADACLIDHPLNLFYLTGLKLSKGELIVGKKNCHLYIDGRYIQAAKEGAPVPSSLFDKDAQEKFYKKEKVKSLAIDSENTSHAQFLKWQAFARKMKIRLIPVPNPIKLLRAIKDSSELHKLRKSAHHLWLAFEHIKHLIKPGVSEAEVALEFKLFGLKNGAESIGFEPIIAFGSNSALPHHRSGPTKFKNGDLALLDLGLVVEGYHSDMTRVLLFDAVEPVLKEFYTVVRKAHDAALKLCRPGVLLKELDMAARKEMKKENLESYFVHGLGHGVGLEIHEFPRIMKTGEDKDVALEKGMVVTIEPGLYLPGKGGVRWEDTIIITSTGYENLYPEGTGA
ncbi:MAG TPA: Xaa-Pro peptidase family protein [Rhabdochlamydiaceae bacterium]|nr:Xaa-Pro peptidase family protein [Rhabdochlamydiaceae bacterium]